MDCLFYYKCDDCDVKNETVMAVDYHDDSIHLCSDCLRFYDESSEKE